MRTRLFARLGFPLAFAMLLCSAAVVVADEHGGEAQDAAEFRPIFDGESLDGWHGDERYWRVEDGVIIGQTTEDDELEQNTFLIWSEGEPDDFELRFQYRVESEWVNTGVQVRSEDLGDYRVAGYQPDIATDDWITGILYEEQGRGILARRGQSVTIGPEGERQEERFAEEEDLFEHIAPHDEWTEYHVIAEGDTIRTEINGELMHELTDQSDEARDSGVIAFQIHTGPAMEVHFRDVELKELSNEQSEAEASAWGWDEFERLFDGESLDGWHGDEQFWRAEDGLLIGQTTEENPAEDNTYLIWSEGEADDFELRFQYRIVSEWGNSGVQVRSEDLGDYQVAGYQPDIATDDWITGILYEERGRAILPRRGQRMHIRPDGEQEVERFAEEEDLYEHIVPHDEWTDYHVIAEGDTIRTKINGELMHELIDESEQARDSGIIAFQIHTGPPMEIHFRNVELKRLSSADDDQAAEHDNPDHSQFQSLFDGESLDNWSGDENYWWVEDGMIVAETTEENPIERPTFLTWAEGEVDDFEFRFEYQIPTERGNSGVQVRSENLEDYDVAGYQPDIATDDWVGALYEEHGRGVLANRGERVHIAPDGERETERFASAEELFEHVNVNGWNEYHVIAEGDTIRTKVNGELMHEVTDQSAEARDRGIIALQLHSPPMRVQFRNIELKRLPLANDRKKVVFVAGPESHGYGDHEHKAGSLLLSNLLDEHNDNILTTVYTDGWPSDPTAFDNADGVVIYSDGGPHHPVLPHLDEFQQVIDRGVGLVCIHYAVEVPEGESGDRFMQWIGGYFEPHWSVNPHWDMESPRLADHPIARGVTPYDIRDEWYYHMRFRDGMDGVEPILTAMPPEQSLERPDGSHSNNPHVREAILEREEPQHLAWAAEREDGGRGFGFTGAHFHWNWGHPMQRRIVLNAIAWTAGAEVPYEGMTTGDVTYENLLENQDYEEPADFNHDHWRSLVEQWNSEYAEAE